MEIRYRVVCAGCGQEATAPRFLNPDLYALCGTCEQERRNN